MLALKIFVSGRVQGVGFRNYVLQVASKHNVFGSVLNTEDGNLIINCVGNNNSVIEFCSKCQIGPTGAKVIDFKIVEIPEFTSNKFIILK